MQNNFSFGRYDRIVIHTPHAGTILPIAGDGHYVATGLKRRNISVLARQLTDHYTDKLFASEPPSILHISFPYSRLFCDVERLINDPLEKKGLGICYDLHRYVALDKTKPIWTLSKEQALNMYHHHLHILALAMEKGGLLLDCHSFSERPNILCRNADDLKDIDICLGFNEDDSKPSESTITFVADFFRSYGYRVELNKPFSNAITTGKGHSLMIEVNKHCYMNEDSLEITAGYYKLHAELQQLYHLLLNS